MSGGGMGPQRASEYRDEPGGRKIAKQVALLELLSLFATMALSWRPDNLWWKLYLDAVHPQTYALAGLLMFSGWGLARLLPEWPCGSDRRDWQWWVFTIAFSVMVLALGFLFWPGSWPTE